MRKLLSIAIATMALAGTTAAFAADAPPPTGVKNIVMPMPRPMIDSAINSVGQ